MCPVKGREGGRWRWRGETDRVLRERGNPIIYTTNRARRSLAAADESDKPKEKKRKTIAGGKLIEQLRKHLNNGSIGN